jgi:hypothetical protein
MQQFLAHPIGAKMASKYLESFPKPLLADLIAGRWLPVVGAGLSRNAVVPPGKEIPLWNALGKSVASELQDYSYSNPIDAISAFEHEYGRPKLIEKLTDLLLIEESRPGEIHSAFCAMPFDLVCTTNFDFLLERQYEITPRNCTPLIHEDQLSIGLRDTGVALLKLHGDLHHPNRLVATEKDYDCFLNQYPLLIMRTAVLVGYSLDDPDFRQLWQVVNDRLGRSRRVAYVVAVGAKPADIARFERRGVKVINLPGSKNRYGSVLASAFVELREYWRAHVIPASQVKEEESLQELSLPRDAQTRLCFFAIPLGMQPFYRDRVFPLVRDAGFVPVTADDVVTPGENWLAKLDALIERSVLVVVDASTQTTIAECRMALARLDPTRVLVIAGGSDPTPLDRQDILVLHRPDVREVDPTDFLESLRKWFSQATEKYSGSLHDEPLRLLRAREYRAAVISAITLLEANLRERLGTHKDPSRRGTTLRYLLEDAHSQGILKNLRVQTVYEWLSIRNEVVHTSRHITKADAVKIVNGVIRIVQGKNA